MPMGHRTHHPLMSGYRRLSTCYERDPRNHLALLGLAAALRCRKRLIRLTAWDTAQEQACCAASHFSGLRRHIGEGSECCPGTE